MIEPIIIDSIAPCAGYKAGASCTITHNILNLAHPTGGMISMGPSPLAHAPVEGGNVLIHGNPLIFVQCTLLAQTVGDWYRFSFTSSNSRGTKHRITSF